MENTEGEVATTPPPFGGRVTENGSGGRGLRLNPIAIRMYGKTSLRKPVLEKLFASLNEKITSLERE